MKGTNWKRAAICVAVTPLVALSLSCCDDDGGVVLIDRLPPAAPQGAYPVTGDEMVTLFWWPNTEPDFHHYEIYWRFEGDSRFKFLADTDESFYVDRGLQNGTTYEYVIVAVDRVGNVSEDSDLLYDTPRPEGSVRLYNIEKRHLGGSFLMNAYDFSEFQRTDGLTDDEADIYFSHDEGLFLMVAKDVGELLTDIQDAGFIPIEDIDWAPDGGWSRTGTVELIMGHSYIVWTRSNNFAKFQVTDLMPDYVMIDWAYQEVTGLPELLRPSRTDTTSRAARGG